MVYVVPDSRCPFPFPPIAFYCLLANYLSGRHFGRFRLLITTPFETVIGSILSNLRKYPCK